MKLFNPFGPHILHSEIDEESRKKSLDLILQLDKDIKDGIIIKSENNIISGEDGLELEKNSIFNGTMNQIPPDLDSSIIGSMIRSFTIDYFKQLEIERDIIDYRDSWLWFGCANAFGSCDEEHRQYLQGEISHFGVFGKKLNEDEVKQFFNSCDSNLETANLNDLIPVSYSDFKTRTPHKAFDYSGHGNHIVMYNPDWGAL